MWYRRITEYNDVENSPIRVTPTPSRSDVRFGQNPFEVVPFGPAPPKIRISTSSKRKLSESNIEETDDVTSFKRVRVISKKDRVKHVPGPFASYITTSGTSILNPRARQQAEEREKRKLFEERAALLGLDHPDTLSSLNALAWCLRTQRKFAAAEDLFRAAFTARKDNLVTEDPEALQVIIGNLMTVLIDQNKALEVDEMWQRVKAMFRSNLEQERADTVLQHLQVLHGSQIRRNRREESHGETTEALLPSNIWQGKESDTSYTHSHLFQSIWRTSEMQDVEEDEEDNDEKDQEQDRDEDEEGNDEKDEEQDRKQDEGYVPDRGQYSNFGNALQAAAHQSNKAVVELLHEKGADVDAKAGDGGTALIGAARLGHEVVVRLLLEKGADVDARAGDGWTALMEAA
jgi:Ankyrin repeats (3 copies)